MKLGVTLAKQIAPVKSRVVIPVWLLHCKLQLAKIHI